MNTIYRKRKAFHGDLLTLTQESLLSFGDVHNDRVVPVDICLENLRRIYSEKYSMVWVGRDYRDHHPPIPLPQAKTPPIRPIQTGPEHLTSRNGTPTILSDSFFFRKCNFWRLIEIYRFKMTIHCLLLSYT